MLKVGEKLKRFPSSHNDAKPSVGGCVSSLLAAEFNSSANGLYFVASLQRWVFVCLPCVPLQCGCNCLFVFCYPNVALCVLFVGRQLSYFAKHINFCLQQRLFCLRRWFYLLKQSKNFQFLLLIKMLLVGCAIPTTVKR
jgi:hypothetical protein